MFRIYGGSDDYVLANIGLDDKCPRCGQKIENPTKAVVCEKEDQFCGEIALRLTNEDGGVIVAMEYDGTWLAHIRLVEEDVLIPWDVKISNVKADDRDKAHSHSVMVSVDCPIGTKVEIISGSTCS